MPSEVRIASSPEEAAAWTGAALVIDVIRFSTTACALAASWRREIRAVAEPKDLPRTIRPGEHVDLYSEMDLGPDYPAIGWAARGGIERFDNSPAEALDASRARRPAVLVTSSGTRALAACESASAVRVGAFCNLSLATAALEREERVLLVPASLFAPHCVEDLLCAEAFRGALTRSGAPPERLLARVLATDRPAQLRAFRPAAAEEDLRLCLRIDSIQALPRFRVEQGIAVRIED